MSEKVEVLSPLSFFKYVDSDFKKESMTTEHVIKYSDYLIRQFTSITWHDFSKTFKKDNDLHEFWGSIICYCMVFRDRCIHQNSIPYSECRRMFDMSHFLFKHKDLSHLIEWRFEE